MNRSVKTKLCYEFELQVKLIFTENVITVKI